MTNPVHVLTVAALLLLSFLVGAVVGTLARLLAMRLGQKPAEAIPAPVEVKPAAAPLVAAPVIAPLPVAAATPVVQPPAEIPVPDFAATLIALANEAPPAGFLDAAKPRLEPITAAKPLPEIRPVPALAPLPVVDAAAAAQMQPAHVAGETTSGVHIDAPLHDEPPARVDAAAIGSRTAEVILFPTAAAEQTSGGGPADIVVGGESVAVVDASDLLVAEPEASPPADSGPVAVEAEPSPGLAPAEPHEDNFLFVEVAQADDATAKLAPASGPESKSETIPVPVIAANAAVGAVIAASLPVPEVVGANAEGSKPAPVTEPTAPGAQVSVDAVEVNPLVSTSTAGLTPDQPKPVATTVVAEMAEEPAASAAPLAAVAERDAAATSPQAAVEPPAAAPEAEPIVVSADEPMDEDAAMRAIEGNWSPRRAPARRPVRPVAEPEGANQAVAASARAVTAARRLAEAVVAEVAEVQAEAKAEAGRPPGLAGPRDGRKDDLTHIIGVLPVIETALNKLGIYHFDQVSVLTDEQIAWIEGHLGVPGRIGRELWREQARELSAVLRPRRVAEK